MRILKRNLCYLFVFFILVAAAGCESSENPKTITIKSLGWFIDNIDYSYWSSGTAASHCFYQFGITYEGDISLSDVSYARIYLPGSSTYWTMPLSSSTFNSTTKRIGSSWFYYTSTSNVLPLGTVKVEVQLTNGSMATLSKLIPAPASNSTDGYSYVHTEDYSTSSSAYVQTLKRPAIVSKSKSSSNISITFTSNDTKFYNGYIWFYDSNKTYLGMSKRFRDTLSTSVSSIINSGSSINNNGTNNTVSLVASDIDFVTGDFNQISSFIVLLTDGSQYVSFGKYSSCDSRAFSPRTSF